MTDDATKEARDAKAARAARLRAALRDNLGRRKQQARGRAAAAVLDGVIAETALDLGERD